MRAVRYVRRGNKTVTYTFEGEHGARFKVSGDKEFRSMSFECIGDFHASGACILNNGNVLFCGGGNFPMGSTKTWEHDVVNNVLISRADTAVEMRDPSVVTLPDGRVLMAGGWVSTSTSPSLSNINRCIYIYDPRTDAWSIALEDIGHMVSKAEVLPDGRVLLIGQYMWVYDVSTNSTTALWDTRGHTKLLSVDPKTSIIAYLDEAIDDEDDGIRSSWSVALWAPDRHHLFGAQDRRAITALALAFARTGVSGPHIDMVLETLTVDRLRRISLARVNLRPRRAPGVLATSSMRLVEGT